MNRQPALGFAIFVFFGILFMVFLSIMNTRSFKRNLFFEFDGTVEKVIYDAKGIPEVTVKGKTYYISAEYNFDYKIQKGDRLKKKRGSNIYTLTKQKTGEVIDFAN